MTSAPPIVRRISAYHLLSDDPARAYQPTRPSGALAARGAVVVGLPLAGRPLQTLI